MPIVRLYAAILFLTAAMAVTGCKKPAADDASVTAAVQTRIAADSALGSESIQSSVQAGVATLTGTVSSDAARALAANDAAQVAGVRTVVNNLSVATSSAAAQQVPPLPPPASVAVNTRALAANDAAQVAGVRTVVNNLSVATSSAAAQQVPPLPPPASVAVNTQPTRVRTLPTKPSAPVERRKIANVPQPQQPPPPSVEHSLDRADHPSQPPAPVPPPQPTFRNVDVPSGTTIPVRITQTLDSATTQQGETFSGTVASDVLVDGLIAIPQGSAVSGRVDAVQEAAHFKGNSLLTIEITSISRRGERIPVSTEAYSKEGAGRGKNTAVKTGVGAAAGAVLGGIFGGGKGAAIGAAAGGGTGAGVNAVTRGQQVQIPSESLVPFRLSNSVNVRVPLQNNNRQDEPARHPLN